MIKQITHIRIRRFLFVWFLFFGQFTHCQSSFNIGFGNAVKTGLGTTFIQLGYSFNPNVEIYVAPSWSMLAGGTCLFVGSKLTLYAENRLSGIIELDLRRSFNTNIFLENDHTGLIERFHLPNADFIVTGIGLKYEFKNEEQIFFELVSTYSKSFKNYTITELGGPNSLESRVSARRRLKSGFGFTLSLVTCL